MLTQSGANILECKYTNFFLITEKKKNNHPPNWSKLRINHLSTPCHLPTNSYHGGR